MIINVSQYNNFLKALIDNEPMLAKVSICGEVSNLRFTDESIFFSLKDAFCQMDCFAYLDKLISGLKNGCEVIVEGSATYLKSGKVSFFVNKITFTEEEGAQFKKLTELKQKLKTLGFFDEDRKKALPKYIFNIGVITSAKGAVLHDIFNVVTRRNKYAKLFLYDVRVQGENASTQIANGIRYLDLQDVDVIIIARGGGSKEDLSAFDSEEIALALRDCSKPTISAVGHETDFSIWEDVHTTEIKSEDFLDFTWYDYTVESGIWYKYCVQKRNMYGDRGLIVPIKDPVMVTLQESSKMLKIGIQYFPVDSIQTSLQLLSISHCFRRLISLVKVENCLV